MDSLSKESALFCNSALTSAVETEKKSGGRDPMLRPLSLPNKHNKLHS